MPPKTPLGEKIFFLRKALKLTQGELAEMIGISRAAVSQFELGETLPSRATQQKLSEALKFDLSEIWRSSPSPDDINDQYASVAFLPIASYPILLSFGAENLDNVYKVTLNKVPVLRLLGVDYSEAMVIEVKGDSMAPRYPHHSRYVFWNVEDLRYATGVHLFILNHKTLLFRRIISNKDGLLTLKADATGEISTLEIPEIESMMARGDCAIAKLGQAVFMPAEE